MTVEIVADDVFEPADVHVAQRLTALAGEGDERVSRAIALLVRALRGGSVCVDLAPTDGLRTAVEASPLIGSALQMDGDLLYLDRYWREEEQVCKDVLAMLASRPPVDGDALAAGLDRVFPKEGYEEQREAARIALSQWLTVLTGGPGTGKTTTVAALLALLAEQAELTGTTRPRIALAAPTGKAANRLQEAVQSAVDELAATDRGRLSGLHAVTLHRLLGWMPGSSTRFKHNRSNRLPYDVIVVDETSMVSLTMMARLLEAVRPETRLVLVGDPDQLASVEAGAVLADLVDGLSDREDAQVAALRTSHRFGESIGALADAIRVGDENRVIELLRAGGKHIEYIDTEDPTERLRRVLVPHAVRVWQASLVGDATTALAMLDQHRLLCAHREGPYGVRHWNRMVERWLTEETGQATWNEWYVARPILVTANDYGLKLYNGDTGVTVTDQGVLRAVIGGQRFATSRLADVETMHAMTIHKSQGSQADEVSVLMPPEDSRLLSRELLYTAVTRAKARIRVIGSEASLRAAVQRRAVRASGLARRLQSA
ncbi:MAG: exodeoxyribonuclease V subunit alpha [Candidatus Sericytochromatia bacterium]